MNVEIGALALIALVGCSERQEWIAAMPVDAAADAPPIAEMDAGIDSRVALGPDASGVLDGSPMMDATIPDADVTPEASTPDGSPDAARTPDSSTCIAIPTTGSLRLPSELSGLSRVWSRPDDDLACPSEPDISGRYFVESTTFCNTGGVPALVDIAMVEGTLVDAFLTIYSGGVIPADVSMCIGVDDDSGDEPGALVTDIRVEAGSMITVAASSFDETDTAFGVGSFTLIITGR